VRPKTQVIEILDTGGGGGGADRPSSHAKVHCHIVCVCTCLPDSGQLKIFPKQKQFPNRPSYYNITKTVLTVFLHGLQDRARASNWRILYPRSTNGSRGAGPQQSRAPGTLVEAAPSGINIETLQIFEWPRLVAASWRGQRGRVGPPARRARAARRPVVHARPDIVCTAARLVFGSVPLHQLTLRSRSLQLDSSPRESSCVPCTARTAPPPPPSSSSTTSPACDGCPLPSPSPVVDWVPVGTHSKRGVGARNRSPVPSGCWRGWTGI
jgi:hypothetical protein